MENNTLFSTTLELSKRSIRGVVAPFFVSIALIFGLFASLIASEIWQKSLTYQYCSNHRDVFAASLVAHFGDDPWQNGYVNEAVSAYVSVIGREELKDWPSDGEDKKSGSLELIRRLFEFAAQPENFHDNAVLNKTFLDELNKVRAARFERD